MNLQTALSLSPKEFWKHPEIVLAIQSVLSPRPWAHRTISTDAFNHSPCLRCGEVLWLGDRRKDISDLAQPDCPVPPPLEDAPETVARKLKDFVTKGVDDRICTAAKIVAADVMEQPYAELEEAATWYAWDATPEQQAICTLLALGKLEK